MAQITSLDALPYTQPGALHPSLSNRADSFTPWDASIDTPALLRWAWQSLCPRRPSLLLLVR